MAAKIIALLGFAALTQAGIAPSHTTYIAPQPAHGWAAPRPVHGWAAPQASHGWEAPANYEFNYEVHDSHTGDIKRQSESAHEGKITGQYSLLDADGLRRVVEYTADDHNGFQATVKREPAQYNHPQPAHGWTQPAPSHGWNQAKRW